MKSGTLCDRLLHTKMNDMLSVVGRKIVIYRYFLGLVLIIVGCTALGYSIWYAADEVSVFKYKYILSPPDAMTPLNVSVPWPIEASQLGWPSLVIQILGFKYSGFFVECYAGDGESYSNTLMLERQHGWTGLLIEADPQRYADLVSKRRKVFSSRSCLRGKKPPTKTNDQGRRTSQQVDSSESKTKDAPCFYLHQYLDALERKNVDYFSLDTRGGELDILKTIPWDRIYIRSLSVREDNDYESKKRLRSYMKRQGFFVYQHQDIDESDSSYIFVNKIKPN